MSADLLAFDECEQLVHLRYELTVAAQNFAGRIDADLRAVDQPMSLGEAVDHMGREFVALEGDDIDAAWPGGGG